jgi:hypothetical protein
MPVSRLWQTSDQILNGRGSHLDTWTGGVQKVLTQGAVLPADGLGRRRFAAPTPDKPQGCV